MEWGNSNIYAIEDKENKQDVIEDTILPLVWLIKWQSFLPMQRK